MSADEVAEGRDRGHLMEYQVECGHWMVCYGLDPTPAVCPDCADTSRKALDDIVSEIDVDWSSDVPAPEELDEWMKEVGVEDTAIQADIRRLVELYDDAYNQLQSAYHEGRRMLEKYPPTERLTMPKESAR